jgi:hypothetical protein
MSADDLIAPNPFVDPSTTAPSSEGSFRDDSIEGNILEIGRSASLTLGTDSLIVLGMRFPYLSPWGEGV